ncbi:MAG TPA: hypothetical protein VKV29_11035 [Chthonomonas sp.]|uniref:hypothetical protein n=1 Tax=Chthonomonas sp. TaxID=2282153 RepID=UPI002B4AE552|nr:hypothetical protein [Chthonomonas sp.]HLH80801.1 hypothetical protein [Chthonomonas sp.]
MVDIRLCPTWFAVPHRRRTPLWFKVFDGMALPNGKAQPRVSGLTGRSKRSYYLF